MRLTWLSLQQALLEVRGSGRTTGRTPSGAVGATSGTSHRDGRTQGGVCIENQGGISELLDLHAFLKSRKVIRVCCSHSGVSVDVVSWLLML